MSNLDLSSRGVRVGLWRHRRDEDTPFCSQEWREIFGFAPDDPLMRLDEMPVLFENWEEVLALNAAREAGAVSPSVEVWGVRRDGERRRLRIISCAETDKLGDLKATFGVVMDITDLAQAFADAHENSELLTAFVENAPAALAMFDREMRYLRVSRRWTSDYHLEGREVIGRSHYDVFPEIQENWKEIHRRCLAGAVERCERDLFVRADGARQWLAWEVRPWFDSAGAVGGILMLTRDITDLVVSMEAVERSEKRLRLALEASGDIVWQRDGRSGEFTVSGGNARLLERVAQSSAPERAFWELVHPDDRAMMKAAFADAVNSGRMLKLEHRMVSETQDERWALSVIEPVRDENGVHVGAIGVLKDITEHKLEERALAAARTAAEASSAAKSEFLATLSHEIRTPLNGVLGVAQALARTQLNAQQREMVELLVSAGGALKALVDESIELGRIESGASAMAETPFDIAATVRETAMLYAPNAREKGLKFETAVLSGGGLGVIGDSLRVRQVVANLVGNAVKFTCVGAVRVEYEAGVGEDGRVAVTVRVRDTGPGFDEESKQRIFERFVQGEDGREGAGLGLAIARGLARAMDGDIDCVSAPNVGSIFTFVCRLPPSAPLTPLEEDITAFEEQDHILIDILVAEDHKMNQQILSMLLSPAKARITFVESGLAACAEAERGHYDLALMDLQMPLLDGLSATRLIRAREAISGRQRMPIICLTAQAAPEKIREAERAGVDGYIVKPIDKDQLYQAIEKVLGGTAERIKAAAEG